MIPDKIMERTLATEDDVFAISLKNVYHISLCTVALTVAATYGTSTNVHICWTALVLLREFTGADIKQHIYTVINVQYTWSSE